jgi:hypothetical protein
MPDGRLVDSNNPNVTVVLPASDPPIVWRAVNAKTKLHAFVAARDTTHSMCEMVRWSDTKLATGTGDPFERCYYCASLVGEQVAPAESEFARKRLASLHRKRRHHEQP